MKNIEPKLSSIDEEIEYCLAGKKLFGDDFTEDQIRQWFRDEELGYYNLGGNKKERYTYGYHALNLRHGYNVLPGRKFKHVLGLGSAYGEELYPILDKSDQITILEPADGFATHMVQGVPVSYVKPEPLGDMPFESATFDMISCFGVLHHIPNVSKVIREIFRCLEPGGYVLIREPVHSMGDWRKPRSGLTRRERGIPQNILSKIIEESGFEILREKKCMFSLTSRLRFLMRTPVYGNKLVVFFDELICSLPIWPNRYHATSAIYKLRPTSVFFVLQRPES